MIARCPRTELPMGECAESCCRPDLSAYQPVPEVWMRVTEPAGRPVVPSPQDVADGNVHALLQVVSGRTARPDVVEMVRELCEPSAHLVRIEPDPSILVGNRATPAGNKRKSKGKQRRAKAGRSAGKAPRYHRNVFPPLLEQLYQSVEPSGSAEAGTARPASSRPAARLDAIDTANRIDSWVSVWLEYLGKKAPADSIARLRLLGSLLPSTERCTHRHAVIDPETGEIVCCQAHNLEADIGRWWTWARVVTGWDTPAWQPANTCPLCGTRGTLRVRLDEQRATCINDGCRETWDTATIGLLAEHIRAENGEQEGEPA